MSASLVQYDAMRVAVAHCARVDEAAKLRNKADKLRAYAKQAKDHELQRWMAEIALRATIKLGQLSRGLEKAPPGPAPEDTSQRREVTPKAQALAEAGITTSVAQRAEALSGRADLDDESGMAAEALGLALETAEVYFDQCRKADVTPNHKELNGVIHHALDDRFGKSERKPPRRRRSDLTNAFIDFTAAIKTLATLNVELDELATHPLCSVARDLELANQALLRLQQWQEIMEEKHVRGDVHSARSISASEEGIQAS